MKYVIITHQYVYNPESLPHFPHWDEAQDLINGLRLDRVSNDPNSIDCHCTIYNANGELSESFAANWFNAIDQFIHDDEANKTLEREDEYEYALRDDGTLGIVNLVTEKTMWREAIINSLDETLKDNG